MNEEIFDNLEGMTEEDIDKILLEQQKILETLEGAEKHSDKALKIFEELKSLPKENEDEKYEDKKKGIDQALSDLKNEIEPLNEKK